MTVATLLEVLKPRHAALSASSLPCVTLPSVFLSLTELQQQQQQQLPPTYCPPPPLPSPPPETHCTVRTDTTATYKAVYVSAAESKPNQNA